MKSYNYKMHFYSLLINYLPALFSVRALTFTKIYRTFKLLFIHVNGIEDKLTIGENKLQIFCTIFKCTNPIYYFLISGESKWYFTFTTFS